MSVYLTSVVGELAPSCDAVRHNAVRHIAVARLNLQKLEAGSCGMHAGRCLMLHLSVDAKIYSNLSSVQVSTELKHQQPQKAACA